MENIDFFIYFYVGIYLEIYIYIYIFQAKLYQLHAKNAIKIISYTLLAQFDYSYIGSLQRVKVNIFVMIRYPLSFTYLDTYIFSILALQPNFCTVPSICLECPLITC